jgi:hypothetical protein
LFTLFWGGRCRSTFSDLFIFFAANSSSRRATFPGASKIRRGSLPSHVRLVNVFKLTYFWASPSSRLSYVCQLSFVERHARWPVGAIMLLTYTHSSLSASGVIAACVRFCVCCIFCVGVGCVCYIRVVGVILFGVSVWRCLFFSVSLAMRRSTCLRIMSYSLSITSSSSSSSSLASGVISAISFPFLDFCGVVFCFLLFLVLGPAYISLFLFFSVGLGVSVRFLDSAMST